MTTLTFIGSRRLANISIQCIVIYYNCKGSFDVSSIKNIHETYIVVETMRGEPLSAAPLKGLHDKNIWSEKTQAYRRVGINSAPDAMQPYNQKMPSAIKGPELIE